MSNVLINLLPDTRLVKQKAAQKRQVAAGIAVAVWVICGGLVVVGVLYTASQNLIISQNTSDIAKKQTKLRGIEGLTDALTAQQHLASLPGLYTQRAYFTKFLEAYTASNPQDVTLTGLTIDGTNLMTINGSAKTFAAAAKLAKALEVENLTIGKDPAATNQPHFHNVQMQSGMRSNNVVAFTLRATLDPGVTNGN